jgi:hypothetical protein
MATTMETHDYLGRELTNETPGSSTATDHLGRDIGESDDDFIGRALQTPD